MTGPSLTWMQKLVVPTFHTWRLKSIQCSYNIHTYLSVIASNDPDKIIWQVKYKEVIFIDGFMTTTTLADQWGF